MAKSADPLKYWTEGTPMVPAAPIAHCPIATSLGVLGKKWTILIIRDMSMRKIERFSDLLKSVTGITPRVLSGRLKELESAGYIHRTEVRKTPNVVRWGLTDKGWDALPILMSYVAFGSKWHADTVFADGTKRDVTEVYPQSNLQRFEVSLDQKRANSSLPKRAANPTAGS
jgi:DNA-binding HxlR family transcriptional regulator